MSATLLLCPPLLLLLMLLLQDYYQSSTSVLHLLTLNEFRANPALLLTLHMDTFLRVSDEGVTHHSFHRRGGLDTRWSVCWHSTGSMFLYSIGLATAGLHSTPRNSPYRWKHELIWELVPNNHLIYPFFCRISSSWRWCGSSSVSVDGQAGGGSIASPRLRMAPDQ